jgi:uncharacterized protein (DUF58 family)
MARALRRSEPLEPVPDTLGLLHDAEHLSDRMPALMAVASRVAQTVAQGLHGRRRAGVGETFWQFRAYRPGDPATMIDWRKSARTERLYVREREWEAANTVWLWVNPSDSMVFRSTLASESKQARALLLCLALAMLLVNGGERIGAFASGMRPSTGRNAARRLAEHFIGQIAGDDNPSLPPRMSVERFSNIVLFSDFFEPVADVASRITAIAARDIHGHLIQVVDPAEETLPYKGRTQFVNMRQDQSLTFGRIEELRGDYRDRFLQHRAELKELARRIGWTFTVHHTDASPQSALLALYGLLSETFDSQMAAGPAAE